MAKKKKKHRGHYCRICGEVKSNESFSGRGHAKHICKECSALPQERRNELQHINQIDRIAGKYPRSQQDWEFLEKMSKNRKYPEAREFAQMILGMSCSLPDMEDNEDEDILECGARELFKESLSFSEFDKDSQEEIWDAVREDIYDIICYEEGVVKEKSKQKALKWITQNLYFGYNQKLILNDELNDLFDSILKEVVEDLEKDEDEDS